MTLDRGQVISWLQDNVSRDRLEHILGVEQMAQALAQRHGTDPDQAAQAGLLHDLAKFFPPPKLLQIARQHGLEIDSICAHVPHLLHADVSAIVARTEFGIQDAQILQAIANHTLGHPGMDQLSCIIFVADALEPNRGDGKKLQKLRQLSEKNLYRAVSGVCDYMLKHLIKQHKIIHPRMILTRNWALQIKGDRTESSIT
ncbi:MULTISPECIES: bis(5'-nucleosyl)-tetraphosphatase (symmetrical) YqeK [Cyanophyceae]|uniref:bis(5'-nucleosyl)-tetraphosphatase (symmetrical) YqeK n=1 Tax=Cyanophyceae TaxID=3028117 RepID=UPI00016DCD45|nr:MULTISPECIES: bis(5'-nucleosyl)-tetraphosphatase (symmetrical) YqeK [Cyanophyceae]ACB00469.1 HD domain protein [Picosynechococcus sp. PCC 7002]ANV91422.1 phosphohydrolase [Picosynechococcus sp. PCC 8807]SMH49609.1 putative HD superfamily hydrolase of NAD metabolism [Picosynechococcus sp. OG1]SMQ81624.1 putative HD superfamily hydrolase of NAD metabolism [Synechococcus sp. 7002]